MTLQGQRALVTGGGRGIGRAIAAMLTQAGAQVSILGRDEAALRDAVAASAAADFATCDVRDESSVSAALDQLSGGRAFDIAIANAGAVETGPFMRSDSERFRRMVEINLIGTVNLFHAVLPGMLERQRGRLIAIASTAGHRGYAYVSAYAAAKHAVIGLVKSLALETARSGVTVNAVCPGYADTDMVASGLDAIAAKTGKSREQALAEMVKDNPQGRLIAPEEVAAAVLYLCGPGSDAVTGQSLLINGGEF
ncbi:SDR family NAD(P)-dependent oxidoreductase [Bosea sp. NBC_00550]|uniref:SDR family NAD(P)-dependent oxidoreductase n=1 Tax=Bosea sp. NBC_00550 TaxID=2969621 RepID=UPI00222E6472|nr:SDR family oxidoreductase [Bosea sp. NBC_00550]UZF93271.1 SDR family oxidoreductase [Bosea sp. NBC_00550]